MKIALDLQDQFNHATEEVRRRLVPLDELREKDMKRILACYDAAIEPNFIPWVAAGVISARSVQGRYAASENLEEEIRGNHQGMLRRFVAAAGAAPGQQDYSSVEVPVQNMRDSFRQMNGLANIAMLAYLENTSAAFIPYLAQIAKTLGSKEFVYTNAHGEADIEHARQFLWALGHESDCNYTAPSETINKTICMGYKFLTDILGLRAQVA